MAKIPRRASDPETLIIFYRAWIIMTRQRCSRMHRKTRFLHTPRQVPHAAGENAAFRDDAAVISFCKLHFAVKIFPDSFLAHFLLAHLWLRCVTLAADIVRAM